MIKMNSLKIEDESELIKVINKVKADCSASYMNFAYAYTESLTMNDEPVNIYCDGEKIIIIPTDYKPIKIIYEESLIKGE